MANNEKTVTYSEEGVEHQALLYIAFGNIHKFFGKHVGSIYKSQTLISLRIQQFHFLVFTQENEEFMAINGVIYNNI